jgi:hypothetical protein
VIVDDVDVVDCACFTHARRHREVLGRVGRTVLPFQLTAHALVGGVGTFVGLLFTWRWWAWLTTPAVAAIIVLVVPFIVGRAAQVSSFEGRSPGLCALGYVRYLFRVRAGMVAGRPVRRGTRRRVDGHSYIVNTTPHVTGRASDVLAASAVVVGGVG